MIILLSIIAILSLILIIYMQHPQFGRAASGKRLERMKRSKNYRNGAFANLSYTPSLTEGYSMTGVLYNFLFKKNPGQKPLKEIPYSITDLHSLPADNNVVIWFGHSSYFMQVNGLKILVDPVFSGSASPVPGTARAFRGSNTYGVKDIPAIDYLLISHDHYDHLDYFTVRELRGKVKNVICGLGVGAHFEQWGYATEKISEYDWNETVEAGNNIKIHTLTARHFSGRRFRRNATLWLAYLLETPDQKIFIGGDSGYDSHFAEIGERFGTIDLAILENGQYNMAWHAIHCLPEEVLKAAKDLNAKRVMPVHCGKFSLAQHSWKEPLNEASRLGRIHDIPLVTPVIGEVVRMDNHTQVFREWWKEVR